MRVIAGEARGFRLKAPEGGRTRPMADKIKGALFSTLASLGVEPERVLDLYAGSGAVGIEALSRSAEWADFVEQNGAACAVIRDNLARTKFVNLAAVHQISVESYLGRTPDRPYDLVIMDPPYADLEIAANLERLGRSALVAPGTIVVVGHSPRVQLPPAPPPLQRLRERCHGDSCFSIYEVGEREPTGGSATAQRSSKAASCALSVALNPRSTAVASCCHRWSTTPAPISASFPQSLTSWPPSSLLAGTLTRTPR